MQTEGVMSETKEELQQIRPQILREKRTSFTAGLLHKKQEIILQVRIHTYTPLSCVISTLERRDLKCQVSIQTANMSSCCVISQ